MENRYKYTVETTGSFSSRHYETTLLPNIKPNIQDIYIYAKSTDRLDILAQKYYGDDRLWWVIAEANKLGKGSFHIPVGKQIRIPMDLGKIDEIFYSIQKAR